MGMQAKGEMVASSKLTEEQVIEIRNLYVRGSRKKGCQSLANKYGVSRLTIHFIVTGKTWKHLIGVSTEQKSIWD